MVIRSLVLAAAFVGLSASSFAASDATDGFVANVRLNANFLTKADVLAMHNGASSDVRQFATHDALDQAEVLDALKGWQKPGGDLIAMEPGSADTLMTGRSVAVDSQQVATSDFDARDGVGAMMPAAAIALGQLGKQSGKEFDATFKAAQIGALQKLKGLYEAYSQTGDDEALRELATKQIPKVEAGIDELAKSS